MDTRTRRFDARYGKPHSRRTQQNGLPGHRRGDGGRAVRTLKSILRRHTVKANIRNIAEAVATVAQWKEEKWEQDLPELDAPVSSIAVGLDGAYVLLRDDGWREAMCGTISLCDKKGNRLHTACFAAPPESGKHAFRAKTDREITRIKDRFPKASHIGPGGGARDDRTCPEPRTEEQLPDFRHVSEYVHKASDACRGAAAKWQESKEQWEEYWFHILKREHGGAGMLLAELKEKKKELKGVESETVQKAIADMENHLNLMDDGGFVARGLPIGSGVTEASCKTVVKWRLCVSGAGGSPSGCGVVLTLRSLHLTESTWDSFGAKMPRYGIPGAKNFGPKHEPEETIHSIA